MNKIIITLIPLLLTAVLFCTCDRENNISDSIAVNGDQTLIQIVYADELQG